MRKFLAFILTAVFLWAGGCLDADKLVEKALSIPGYDPNSMLRKMELYKKAIRLCPTHAQAHNNLADLYERQGRFPLAIKHYKIAAENAPQNAIPYFSLGDVYLKTGRYQEAERWYKKGLSIDPSDSLTRKRLALLEDFKKGLVKAETIEKLLKQTRGAGEVVSLSFGESLIPFDFNKYNIRPDAEPQLKEIGKALKHMFPKKAIAIEAPSYRIEVAGHTDLRGSDAYNLWLSRKRAEAVVNYLVEKFSLPKQAFIINGYGKRRPLCTQETEACHALNRRVEIRFVPQKEETRGASAVAYTGSPLKIEAGFFYKRPSEKVVHQLDGASLRSGRDQYFIFFRPAQHCYVYILQKDSTGKVQLLYPKGGNLMARAGKDYWVPGINKAFTLDFNTGREEIYLIVSEKPLKPEEDYLTRAAEIIKTRAVYSIASPKSQAPSPSSLLTEIKGKGAFLYKVEFNHI